MPALSPAALAANNLTGNAELLLEIQKMNSDVQSKKGTLNTLNSRIEQYNSLIAGKRIEIQSLEDQMAVIENRIARQQLQIDIIRSEIDRIELEMQVLESGIAEKESEVERERQVLGALARKLYREGFSRSWLEILLSHRTLNGFFDALHAISRLQAEVNDSLGRLQEVRSELAAELENREAKRAESQSQKQQLEVAKLQMEEERALKSGILNETKSSETQYRYMLADLRREQQEANADIQNLERVLRQKVELAERLKVDSGALSWPVSPARGITATFHDKSYPFRHIMEHSAIDIRAYQGTPVKSAAAGVVARAKNAGMGYSYIMILHSNGISTVYGHISKIVVKEDAFVERGELIGYSGGQPGTPGAGNMTTGPHLHFEVRLDGIPVDPMKYLVSI